MFVQCAAVPVVTFIMYSFKPLKKLIFNFFFVLFLLFIYHSRTALFRKTDHGIFCYPFFSVPTMACESKKKRLFAKWKLKFVFFRHLAKDNNITQRRGVLNNEWTLRTKQYNNFHIKLLWHSTAMRHGKQAHKVRHI